MLVNFRFGNAKSFYNENQLSLQAASIKEFDGINTFSVNKDLFNQDENNSLLKSAIIFGANASGKSNVLKCLTYMRNAVLTSSSPQMGTIQNNAYFAFYKDAVDQESLFEVEIIQNNIFYRYGFTILHGKVNKEYLFKKQERLTQVFNRENNKIDVMGDKIYENFIKVPEATLFLSASLSFNLAISKYMNDVIEWFRNLIIVFEHNANSLDIYTMENGKYKNQALNILKKADIGIQNMQVIKDKVANLKNINELLAFDLQRQVNPNQYGQIKQENENMYNIDLDTVYNVYDKDDNIVKNAEVLLYRDRGFHSEGTIRLLCYLGWILYALDKGNIILLDEIDSKLHFLVADYLIKMFNSIDHNPNNAQLICTAHNVMLMDDNLRRDQIYFTCKNAVGVSELSSLVDYTNVRKKDLFSKKYLAGFYSNLPNMYKKV